MKVQVQRWCSSGGPEVVQMYHIADQVQVQRYRRHGHRCVEVVHLRFRGGPEVQRLQKCCISGTEVVRGPVVDVVQISHVQVQVQVQRCRGGPEVV